MTDKIKREFIVESYTYSGLVLYEVSLDDLNQIEKETYSVGEDFGFAIFSASTAVSFTIVLATVVLPAGTLHDVFWIVTILGYVGSAYFGLRWLRTRRDFKSAVRRIKERAGPFGEQGREIDQAQLASLSAAEVDKT